MWRASYQPQGLTSAQLNLPYCVATLLLEGDVFVDQFTEAMVDDPDRIRLSRLVQVIEDPAITARGKAFRHMVRVEVMLQDGVRMEETVEAPRGSEHSFASADAVIGKFRTLAGARFDAGRTQRIIDAVMGADALVSAASLAALLGKAR
jgi:aconitate decarboxylase